MSIVKVQYVIPVHLRIVDVIEEPKLLHFVNRKTPFCKVLGRRDKKAFFSDRCKEIEENNRMGKTRNIFKNISDTKETFHAKMGK